MSVASRLPILTLGFCACTGPAAKPQADLNDAILDDSSPVDTGGEALTLPPEAVVLDHVRVVDAAGTLDDVAVVLVSDTIVDVMPSQPSWPEHVVHHDLTGRTLIPGLIDAHVHLFLDGTVTPVADNLGRNLTAALTWGIVGVADLGAPTEVFALRDRIDRHELAGPRIWATGPFVTVPGAHPCETHKDPQQCLFIETSTDGPAHVRGPLAPANGVKLALADAAFTPWPTPRISADDVLAVVSAAHDQGQIVAAHVDTPEDTAQAIDAGVDLLGHPPFDEPGAPSTDTPTTTTLSAFAGTSALLDGDLLTDNLVATPRAVIEQWTAVADSPRLWLSDDWITESRTWEAAAQDNVQQAITNGTPLLAGSDAGYLFVPHGLGLHRELEALVAAGMTPIEALTAATATPAHLFGWTDLGFIAPGYRASFVVLTADPSVDIRATRSIEAVWLNGEPLPSTPAPVVAPGADPTVCLSESDCPDPLVCDRVAHHCVPACPTAYDRISCDAASACLPSDLFGGEPVCHALDTCSLTDQDCAPEWYGDNCVPVDHDTNRCWPSGPRTTGQACSWTDPTAFCAQGLYCSWDDYRCHTYCDPEAPDACDGCAPVLAGDAPWFYICL